MNVSTPSETLLLRFPNYQVNNGRCRIQGSQTLLLSKQGDRLYGKLPWIWDEQHDAATLTGYLTGQSLSMTLTPPSIGGFRLSFRGEQKASASSASTSYAGVVEAHDYCRNIKGNSFTLTLISPVQPNRQSAKIPLFQKPFELEYLITNYFDHKLPQQFQDNNGALVTWNGQELLLGSPGASIDGHAGYDWATPEGTPLLAVADGTVFRAEESEPFFCPLLGKMTSGLDVYLEHTAPSGDRFMSEYVHLSRIDVQSGQAIKAGDVIGLSGNTGCSTGPHLHFGVYRIADNQQWKIIDPYGWSGSTRDPWSQAFNGTESVWLWKEGKTPILYEWGQ
jgi:murein DD-endopeptidase MepM/ murein hydrolase activator NlpD